MANTKSALKAIRKSEKNYVRNLAQKRAYKEAKKNVLKAVEAKDKVKASELMPLAQKALDKAAKNKVIEKATASRYKSRLVKKIKSLE